MIDKQRIVSVDVDATVYPDATRTIESWAKNEESRFVCLCNVHMVMEAYDSPAFQRMVNGADLVTPDGMPLVWGLRALGIPSAERVYGPTLTLHIAEMAAREGIPIGLYGGAPDVVEDFSKELQDRYPVLDIPCVISPPYRPLTDEEDRRYTHKINESGARILLVGLGCPKQEKWMHEHRGRVNSVMLGVGAAFDFHTGRVQQAPEWVQQAGLEWAFRTLMEPRRLFLRQFKHNPRFLAYFARQFFLRRMGSG